MSSGNTSKNKFEEWLNSLDPDRRKDMEHLWDAAKKTDDSKTVSVNEDEKADAFNEIIAATNMKKPTQIKPLVPEEKSSNGWKWMAAAATILIVSGLSYLTLPVTVTAPRGEMVSIELPDNSSITLNSGSTLSYSRLYNYWGRELSLEGEAFFEVQKNSNEFIVHTSNATVKVLGTSFNLKSWQSDPGAETSVVLTEGSLAFYPAGNPTQAVVLKAGEKSSLQNAQLSPEKPLPAAKEKALAWMQNRFAFENQQIVQIIMELERRFDLSITVNPKQILTDSLTIYYNNEVSAEQIIRDISQSKGLTYRRVNRGFIIEQP